MAEEYEEPMRLRDTGHVNLVLADWSRDVTFELWQYQKSLHIYRRNGAAALMSEIGKSRT
ncbi:hypothetical protein BDW75DRAFT_221369 [Aspergillus navahoensis]